MVALVGGAISYERGTPVRGWGVDARLYPVGLVFRCHGRDMSWQLLSFGMVTG